MKDSANHLFLQLAAIVSGPQSLFNVSGQAHPSYVHTCNCFLEQHKI